MQSLLPVSDRTTTQRIRLRISKQYHQEPVISHLISQFNLTVNILAAILGANATGDGWFDLELKGHQTNIEAALTYLNELDLELWQGEESDGW